MQLVKVRGLVLREYEAGESDKRLLIFCKEHGRLMAYARGARKPTSKFMAAAQVFTYGDFVLAKGRGFYSLTQAEIIENFYPLRQDYDRLISAYKIVEVCEKTLWDNIESDELLKLTLKSLSVLAKGEVPPGQVNGVFLTRFFDVSGFRPQMDACVVCDSPVVKPFLCKEGLVCHKHKPAEYQPLSTATVAAIRHILDSTLSQAFKFTATEEVLAELNRSTKLLWDNLS